MSSNSQIAEFGWAVQSYDLDQGESPVFFLQLVSSASNVVVTSHYFNISSSSSVGTLSTTWIPLPDPIVTPRGSPIKRNLTSSSTSAISIIPTSIPGSTTTIITPLILITPNAIVIGSKNTTNSTVCFFLTPESTTAAASPATLDPSVLATKPLPMPYLTGTHPIKTLMSSSSTPYTSQILKDSSSQPAQLDSDSNTELIEVAVVFGTAGLSIVGLFIFCKVQKRKMLRLELQRRQKHEHWPRLTILNVCGRSFSQGAGTPGNNDASEVSLGAQPPVELESQRPVAEMPGV